MTKKEARKALFLIHERSKQALEYLNANSERGFYVCAVDIEQAVKQLVDAEKFPTE